MKRFRLSKKIFILCLIWSCVARSGSYSYADLQMKTYDEMLSEVKTRVRAAERLLNEDDHHDEAKSKLKDALRLIFSRPDSDNMVSQLVPLPRTSLKNMESYETTIQELVVESIALVQSPNTEAKSQVTALTILTNVLSELKPEASNQPIVYEIFEQIRNAKIKVSDKAKKVLRLRSMTKPPPSPSDMAAQILSKIKKPTAEKPVVEKSTTEGPTAE